MADGVSTSEGSSDGADKYERLHEWSQANRAANEKVSTGRF